MFYEEIIIVVIHTPYTVAYTQWQPGINPQRGVDALPTYPSNYHPSNHTTHHPSTHPPATYLETYLEQSSHLSTHCDHKLRRLVQRIQ